ncbi:cytochrome b [Rhodopseudomonas palustris]|uniref:Cytochrome B n=1 Tax=Rhodopseudomonas palustris TaxID=1076 RepID=A0A418VL82_RHOPL|nr:cytochrome b/b6 domain-containing protein [Rhodopseudomonas palustris]RJF76921.1 cytochrome B [Rhodopseudomonas palustris]
MTPESTPDRYGFVAVSIHWLSAILILVLLVSGFGAAGTDDVAAKAAALRIHLPIAALVLVLTALRIAWWLGFDLKPDPLPDVPGGLRESAARVVHLLLYVVLLGMVASGIGMMLRSGAVPIVFGADPAALPDFWRYRPRVPHGLGARLLVGLLTFHIAAALYHHYIRRDGMLRRMWFTH